MGRLGNWDNVEKRKRPVTFTKSDEIMEYLKLAIWILLACVYCYFMIWG